MQQWQEEVFVFWAIQKGVTAAPNLRSGKMKRNLIFLFLLSSVMLELPFLNSLWAQCPEDPTDLGICDTLYVETFDCYHNYQADPGSFDSVLVAVYITHDSNTFWWQEVSRWVQDSINSFVVPLTFWHPASGCADSVILPTHDQWNNTEINPYVPWMNRSMFRHIGDTHTGDTTYNRMLLMVENFKTAWSVYTDFESHSSSSDSGRCSFSLVPFSPTCQRWWEGSRTLLATLTFHVYLSDACDTAEICLDSVFWPPDSYLSFGRHDARIYRPRHNLPVCDTVYTDVRWIEDSTPGEIRSSVFSISQNHPNPFNPATEFTVAVPKASHVKIEIFNILGQKVKTLVDKDMKAGVYLVDWDGKDERGAEVSSGVYFYRIVADDFSDIKKMVLVR